MTVLRHGLSYTSFSLSDLVIEKDNSTEKGTFNVKVSVNVKNEGAIAGAEVVQVYISYPDKGITHPKMQLRGFVKAKDLQPGESRKVEVLLDKYAFSYWEVDPYSNSSIGKGEWRVGDGEYDIQVGTAFDKIVLEGKVVIAEEESFVWSGL